MCTTFFKTFHFRLKYINVQLVVIELTVVHVYPIFYFEAMIEKEWDREENGKDKKHSNNIVSMQIDVFPREEKN